MHHLCSRQSISNRLSISAESREKSSFFNCFLSFISFAQVFVFHCLQVASWLERVERSEKVPQETPLTTKLRSFALLLNYTNFGKCSSTIGFVRFLDRTILTSNQTASLVDFSRTRSSPSRYKIILNDFLNEVFQRGN